MSFLSSKKEIKYEAKFSLIGRCFSCHTWSHVTTTFYRVCYCSTATERTKIRSFLPSVLLSKFCQFANILFETAIRIPDTTNAIMADLDDFFAKKDKKKKGSKGFHKGNIDVLKDSEWTSHWI